jgi:hypothetical protein
VVSELGVQADRVRPSTPDGYGGVGPGPSQKADRAWPETPGQSVARHGGVEPGPSQKADRARSGTLWGLGNFRIWFSRHGFQDLRSQLWGLGNFRIWFSRHGFQDLGSQLWGLDFHTCGFQDQNLKTFRT